MVKHEYARGYEEGITVAVNAIERAIKRNEGAKTVVNAVAALNDIIAYSHQLRSEITTYKYSTDEPSQDPYDEVAAFAKLFPGSVFVCGGEGK